MKTNLKGQSAAARSKINSLRTHFGVLFLIFFLWSSVGWGQSLSNYTFSSVNNGSLDPMTSATSLAGTGSLVTGYNDDYASAVTNIGFTFIYMGTPYTQFSVNSNGQLRLGTTSVGGSAISSTSSSTAIIAPMSGDNSSGFSGDADPISYVLTGSSPNRILKIQWKNFQIPFNLTGTIGGDMQVWLYETGAIDFIYGNMYNNSSSTASRSIFLSSSNTATTMGSITVGASPTFTASTTLATNSFTASSNISNLYSSSNVSRRVYKFTPLFNTTPTDPSNLTFTSVTTTTETPNWVDNSSDETFFIVTRANDASFTTGVVVANVASTTTAGTGTAYSLAQTGLTPGTTYYYKIQAANEAGLVGTGITGSQATTSATTYYYVGAATGSDFSTATSWNTNADGSGTNRTVTATTDILIIDGIGTTNTAGGITIGMAASQSLGALQITNSTAVTIQSNSASTMTLTLTGSVGDELSIPSGSSLSLNHASQAAAINFSTGTGMTGNIEGTLSFAGSTSNIFTTTGGTGTMVNVGSTGVVNMGNTAISLVGSTTTLTFLNGSNCNVTGTTTGAYPIPLATWETNSNLTLSGAATSTTTATNRLQSFGNFIVNLPSLTSTLSFWTTSTTAIIKGNLVITAAGTSGGSGIFKALTSGTLTVNGNVIITQGRFQSASGSGTFNVLGNTTISTNGILDINGGTYNQRGATFTNDGTLTAISSTTNLAFSPLTNIAQTFAGSGTVLTNIGGLSLSNPAGLTITHTNQIITLRVNLFQGTITGSNKITIGTGSTNCTTQIGSAGLTTSGGSFDALPTFNLGTGTYSVIYSEESTSRTTGFEIPTNRSVSAITIANNNDVTLAGGNLAIGTLTLSGGNFITSSSNLATVTGTTTTSIVRSTASLSSASSVGTTITVSSTSGLSAGMIVTVTAGTGAFATNTKVVSVVNTTTFTVSAAPTTALSAATVAGIGGWVNGPLELTLPANLVSGSTYLFPIGKTTLYPFELVNPTTNAGGTVVVRAEVFDGNSGGTAGNVMATISSTRYWAANVSSGGSNFTNTRIRLNDASTTGLDAIANSTTINGSYNLLGGITSTVLPTSILIGSSITSISGFYLMGTKAAAATLATPSITPSGNQCTNVSRAISVVVTPGGAAVTSVALNYSINGAAQAAIAMTNTTNTGGADTWTATIPTVTPTNASITWFITATDANSLTGTVTGVGYQDNPNLGITATASATPSSVCAGSTTSLSVSVNAYPLSELFNNSTTSQFSIVNTSGTGSANQNITYYSEGTSSFLFNTSSTSADVQLTQLNAISLVNVASATLSFSHICATEAGYDYGYVQYSTNNGSTWSNFPTTSYSGSATLKNSAVCFDKSSYSDWGSQFSSNSSTPGTGPATTLWKNESITIPSAALTSSQFKIRFRYTTDVSGNYYGWLIDNLKIITVLTPTANSWSDGSSSFGTSNPQSATVSSTTTYTCTATVNSCPMTASVTPTVNSLPSAPTGNTTQSICPSSATVANLTATGSSIQWFASSTGGTALATTTALVDGTHYYASQTTNGCSSATRLDVTALIRNQWSGSTSSDWNTSSNWSCSVVPGSTNNAFIPTSGITNYPVLSVSAAIKNLNIGSGTIDLNGQTLTINGAVTGTGTISGSATSSIVIGANNAAGTLNFTSGSNTLKNLTLNTGSSATLGNALNIATGATPGVLTVNTGATLNTGTGGFLTLKSDITGTARVANSAGTISGEVSVERYIPQNINRAWRALAVPTYSNTQTIANSWQLGTLITGPGGGNGLDQSTGGFSMMSYNPATDALVGVGDMTTVISNNTAAPAAYYLYVRGDRNTGVANTNLNPTATTLSSKGTLYQGTVTVTAANNVSGTTYHLLGNPYVSPINLNSFYNANSLNIDNTFYLYDPQIYNTGTGVGALITLTGSGSTYTPSVIGGSYSGSITEIPSGMAFFITKSSGSASSIVFNENMKTTGSTISNGYNGLKTTAAVDGQLQVNLNVKINDSTVRPADGILAIFDANEKVQVDGSDARKMSNFGENMSINNQGDLLAIEKRPLFNQDTLHINTTGLTNRLYSLRFNPSQFQNASSALLIDHYTNSTQSIPLQSVSEYAFTIDANAQSKGPNRFDIVFEQAALQITNTKKLMAIELYPNPVSEGVINISMHQQQEGNYTVSIVNALGAEIQKENWHHSNGDQIHSINVNKLASGIYYLKISNEFGDQSMHKFIQSSSNF